jgi:hypothetical protein
MVRLMGGNAWFGILLGMAMLGLGVSEHLTLLAVLGGFVGLTSLWRLVDGTDDDSSPRR